MKPIKISYIFNFNTPNAKTFELQFNPESMEYISQSTQTPPDWTLLENNKCSHCPLDSKLVKYCPVAKNIHEVAAHFANEKSYNEISVGVITEDRSFIKKTSLQDGLFSILGLMMPTSGCPHMAFLKPMARLHMPFSNTNETLIRSLSMYLLKQYFRFKKGEAPDWNLDKLEENYSRVNTVNQGIIARIRTISKGDAGQNAIVILDGFASMLALEKSTNFSEIDTMLTFKNSF